uniref:uncharacterized protein LOC122607928 n=1 Tax=Erigeron canadensis TaxID=72917 RepID=UPI001CB95A03|nr:uncharacterized protein LOC122607928 [Erigeron canadensis]
MDTHPETLEDNDQNNNNNNMMLDDDQETQQHEFETFARSWLSTLQRPLTQNDVDSWLQSNTSSLPAHIKSMPSSDVYLMLNSFLNDGNLSNEEKPPYYFQFQRSDQWKPIYTWLETLKTDEVIKSKEIIDWLTENPEVRDDLSSRHSRYHLMHYIKKCHMKILKRKEKKKGLHTTLKISSPIAQKTEEKRSLVVIPRTRVAKLPKDSPIYLVKRNEAVRKFEILVEMEKQLATLFQNQEATNAIAGP